MFSKRWAIGLLALAVGTGAARAGDIAPPQPATQQDLQAQINELKAELRELKAQQHAASAAQTAEADQAATEREVAADAARRSQLFDADAGGVTSGHANRRFFIQSDDGSFLLRPWVQIQVREVQNVRGNTSGSAAENNLSQSENGLEIRRAKLGFDGNLFGKDLTYSIDWSTNRQNSTSTYNVSGATDSTPGKTPTVTTTNVVGGAPVLEEAWLKYGFHDTPWYIRAGQMHDPLAHESFVGSKYRAPEASLQADIFGNTDTYTQAVTLGYDPDKDVRVEGGLNHGIRSANTGFQDPPENGGPANAYDGGVAGRVEWKLQGAWKDYGQFTALGNSADLFVLGSGYDYSFGSGRYYTLSHTLDAQYATPNGWFAYASYFGRYTNHQMGIPNTSNPGASFGSSVGDAGADTYEPSIMAQLGYLLDPRSEPFVRYEYMHLAGTPAKSHNDVTAISGGFNYYIYGHNLKLTGMVSYLPTGIPISDTSDDVLMSNNKPETVIILQVELLL